MQAISRRSFLKASSGVVGGLAMGRLSGFTLRASEASGFAALPAGSAPLALPVPHFPDRLHAFVWRNWSLVPIERMARVVGARPAELIRLGHGMGLTGPKRISLDQQRRSYLSVIKRNWHLLPYEQLLELLGWDAEQMAYTLREDDFLFVKLGNLKPRCEILRYRPPDEVTLAREKEIAGVVAEHSGVADKPHEPLFGFIKTLSQNPKTQSRAASSDTLRFCYSYFALYGDPLLDRTADPYPDGYLARLAQAGVNGVWLQAVLYKLAPFPWDPKLSEQHAARLENLRILVARARKHGIRVFLYLNEPRAMPLAFFEHHPELKGVTEGDHAALCTSRREVQEFLTGSVTHICRNVPDLGGFFSITASENLTNCWSHGNGGQCPACAARGSAETIAGVNRLFQNGIHAAGTPARLLAWEWGWNDSWAPDAIAKLPAETALMSVSEWKLPIERGGIKSEVGEYSISAIGPGPRARKHWQIAGERGLKAIAKIQAGNTWELSAVPYIPAVENVARHAQNLCGAGVNGFMLGWTLGGYPSPNLEVVSETLRCGSADTAMQQVAERRFGPVLAPAVLSAWHDFSAAFREFPYDGGVVYSAPQQLGPANLLWAMPTGYHATMVGFPYDDLDAWRSIYPAEIFISQMRKVADGFFAALDRLKATAARLTPAVSTEQRRTFEAERGVAEATAIHFRSVANQARFVLARRRASEIKQRESVEPLRQELKELLEDEIRLARRLHQLQLSDSRLGFEASNQYFYVPLDLLEKILNCQFLLEHWLPGVARNV